MHIFLQRVCLLYGTGSIAGALVVLVMWFLGVFAEQFSFLAFNLNVDAFFPPVVFGGLGGLLYFLRTSMKSSMQAVVYSIPISIAYLSYGFGWLDVVMFKQMDISYFLRPESLVIFAIFALVWGGFTKYVNVAAH